MLTGERLFDYDPVFGITRWFSYDEDTDECRIRTVQVLPDADELNKYRYNNAAGNWRGEMHKVAEIPMALYFDLKRKGILDDPKATKRWLNDPDNRVFRTKPGRV